MNLFDRIMSIFRRQRPEVQNLIEDRLAQHGVFPSQADGGASSANSQANNATPTPSTDNSAVPPITNAPQPVIINDPIDSNVPTVAPPQQTDQPTTPSNTQPSLKDTSADSSASTDTPAVSVTQTDVSSGDTGNSNTSFSSSDSTSDVSTNTSIDQSNSSDISSQSASSPDVSVVSSSETANTGTSNSDISATESASSDDSSTNAGDAARDDESVQADASDNQNENKVDNGAVDNSEGSGPSNDTFGSTSYEGFPPNSNYDEVDSEKATMVANGVDPESIGGPYQIENSVDSNSAPAATDTSDTPSHDDISTYDTMSYKEPMPYLDDSGTSYEGFPTSSNYDEVGADSEQATMVANGVDPDSIGSPYPTDDASNISPQTGSDYDQQAEQSDHPENWH